MHFLYYQHVFNKLLVFSFLAIFCVGTESAQTPTITVSVSPIVFNAAIRGPRLVQTVRVTSSVPGSFYINVSSGPWLSAPQDDFTTPATLTIAADPRGFLNPTAQGGTLTFVGFGSLQGAIATVAVTMNVGTVGGGSGAPVWGGPITQTCQYGPVSCPLPLTLYNGTGTGPITFSLHSGSLPRGMFLDSSNSNIAAFPTGAGVFTFRINATDTLHTSVSDLFTVTVLDAINSGPQTFLTTSLPNGTNCTPYSATILSTGGNPPYQYGLTVNDGSLPRQLTLSRAGVISGSAFHEGVYPISITSNDSFLPPHLASRTFLLNILPCGTLQPLVISTPAQIPLVDCATANLQLAATGGIGPYTWSVASNSTLPANLTLTSSGVLSGSSIAPGIYTFNISVKDSTSVQTTTSKSFTLEVINCQQAPPLAITTVSPLPNQSVCSNTPIQLIATGGIQPVYSWSITSGALPRPMTLSQAGLISGIPYHAGVYNFFAQVQDLASARVSRPFTLTVNSCGASEAVEPLEGALSISSEGMPGFKLALPAESDLDGTLEIFPANAEGEFAYFANALRQVSFNIKAGTSEAVFPKHTGRLAMLSRGGAATVVPTLYRKGIPVSPESNTLTVRDNGTVE